jgi:hypothetical protein
MAKSSTPAARPATVDALLASLPADRRAAVEAVRAVILENLDEGYEEGVQYGMIAYFVPHSRYPAGYHCDPKQPLPYVAIGCGKSGISLHMFCLYAASEDARWFREAWSRSGKKLDMGKACVRFKRIEDVPLEVIGEAIRRTPAAAHIAAYEAALGSRGKAAAKSKPAAKAKANGPGKPARKKTIAKAAKTTAAKAKATSPTRKKAAAR